MVVNQAKITSKAFATLVLISAILSCTAAVTCDVGYYYATDTANNVGSCQICPAGYQCPSSGAKIACTAGAYSVPGQVSCTTCPTGYICPTASALPQICAQGSYPNAARTACTTCTAGYACPSPTLTTTTCSAPSTFTNIPSATECFPCPAGSSCSTASSTPSACSSGKVSVFGSGTCTTVPAGSFAPTSLMAANTCPAGTYTSSQGQSRCIFCPAGSQCSSTSGSPTTCPSGSLAANATSYCQTCLSGYVCSSQTQASMTACADGTYASSNTCIACPAGQYCSETAVLGSCPLGTTSPLASSTCTLCPPGYACPSSTSTPVLCSSPNYVDLITYTCTSCPSGKECPSPTSAPRSCPSGYYSLSGVGSCQICPEGSYCPNAATLTPCPLTQISGQGYLACIACPAGYSCPTQKLSSLVKCSSGQYSPLGSTVCTSCLPGQSCPALSHLDTCIPGTWQAASGSSKSCDVCPPLSWCPGNSTSALTTDPVLKNNYNGFGTTSELVCPGDSPCGFDIVQQGYTCAPGSYFVPNAATDCQTCVSGQNYCQKGKLAQCPAGTYVNSTIPSSTEACIECLDQRLCIQRGPAPSGGWLVQNFCYKRGTNTQYVSNLTNSVRFSQYDYQTCFDCNSTELKDSICTFTGTYFTSQAGAFLTCPWGSSSFLFNDTTTNTSYSVSKYWEANYTHAFCQRNLSLLTVMQTGQSAQSCGNINQYPDAKQGSCKPVTPGFVNLGTNTPTATPIQALYSILVQDQFGTQVKGTECPWSSDTVMTGGSQETQACMMRPAGTCQYTTSDYCHDGAEFMCPAGFALGSTQGHKTLSDCITGGAGSYYNSSSKTYACDAGRFCLNMTQDEDQYAARPGRKITTTGAQSYTSEVACTAGYCPPASSTDTLCPPGYKLEVSSQAHDQFNCHPVAQGTYYDPSAGTSTTCTLGSYCPEAVQTAGQMIPCPPGTYGASTGLGQVDQCTPCPAGSSCPAGTVATSQGSCPAGFFCPNVTTFVQEFACPAGTYSVAATGAQSASQCIQCPAGSYCQEGASAPVKCTYNKYCPAGSSQETDCPPATHVASTGQLSASSCPACGQGHVCPGGCDEVNCPSGTYEDTRNGVLRCKNASIGYWSAGIASGTENLCAPGTYAVAEASTGCLACPTGSYCAGDGTMLPCPSGSYCPLGSSSPQICPSGAYCNATGVGVVQPCPAGSYCPDGGSPRATPANYYNLQQESSGTLHACGNGFLCLGNSIGPYDSPCPANTYALQGATSCSSCPAGSYCPVGSGSLQPCPLGWYCLLGTSPQKCPKGTYGASTNLAAATDCTPCPAGYTCSESGLTATDGLCDPGYYCTGGSWTPRPSSDNTQEAAVGGLCPMGSYCPRGSSSPQPCPLGTFNSFPGMRAASDCVACTAGYYCKNANSSTPTGPCQAGYYCTGGSSTPTQYAAKSGYYALSGSAAQIACLPGSYSSASAAVNCTLCDSGTYCAAAAMTTGVACPAGFYCALGSIAPTPCPIGTANSGTKAKNRADCSNTTGGYYADQQAETSQTQVCQAGYFCTQGSPSGTPAVNITLATYQRFLTAYGLCPRGYWCPAGTSQPQACPSGYFLDSEGATSQSQCEPCTAGYYCAQAGLAAPTGQCDPGYWCSASSLATTPQNAQCPAGTYCPTGSGLATLCPAGTYSPAAGASACADCPAGSYCPAGSSSAQPCPAGAYCPAKTEYASQYLCPSGTYNDQVGSVDVSVCLVCPPGAYCSVAGAVWSTGFGTGNITAGYYNGDGRSTSPIPSTTTGRLCSIGSYCQGGLETPCPAGSYCNRYGLSQPAGYCLAGFYCSTGATSLAPTSLQTQKGAVCPAGFYCEGGQVSATPTPCPIGTYSNSVGLTSASQCKSCPAGYLCNSTSTTDYTVYPCPSGVWCPASTSSADSASPCPIGSYCPSGSPYPLVCQAGTYNPSLNQSTCLTCQIGYYCPYQAGTGIPNQLSCPQGYYCNQVGLTTPTPCPIGTYADFTGAVSCKNCPAGYYCDQLALGDISSHICPGGFYCPAGTSIYSSYMCGLGRYCPQGSSAALACPGGSFCAGYALSSPSGSCESGYYCLGSASQPNPTDGVTGGLCPAGSYCEAGSTKSVPCPIGTYNDKLGAPAPTYCLACPANKICDELGLAAPKAACSAGYWCPANGSPEPCPIGHYCPASISVMLTCPLGSFQNETRQVVCKSCPAGYYCGYDNNGLLTTATPCPQGFFCAVNSSDYSHTPCAAGTYGASTGLSSATQCTACPYGKYCARAGLITYSGTCEDGYLCQVGSSSRIGSTLCPQNYYCQTGVATECPAGAYSKNTGATSVAECVWCPPGKYCPTHFDNIQSCPAGRYCTGGLSSASQATLCPVGSSCPTGSAAPQLCAPGTYSASTGAATCASCPASYYCYSPGTSTPTPCLANMTCAVGSVYPKACAKGQYADASSVCQPCPKGKYCWPELGTNGIAGSCLPGYVCQSGSYSPRPYFKVASITASSSAFTTYNGPAFPGYYSLDGANNTQCPPGQFQPSAYAQGCLSCYAGKYCPNSGMSSLTAYSCSGGYICHRGSMTPQPTDSVSGQLCPAGYYCSGGAILAMTCPDGSYTSTPGQESCSSCPPDYYCNNTLVTSGGSTRTACTSGTTCPGGNAAQPLCNAGYQLSGNQCQQCTLGKYCLAGRVAGPCAAGYYCLYASSSPNPSGQLCSVGKYCPIGTTYQVSCPTGLYTVAKGGQQLSDCAGCLPGYVCNFAAGAPSSCPKGFYCPIGTTTAISCPKGTYSAVTMLITANDCTDCPAGYLCSAANITDYTNYPCPKGHFCPVRATYAIACPPGTQRGSTGAAAESDCALCPAGFYCPAATATPIACLPGTYCPTGSKNYSTCLGGFYCSVGTSFQLQSCPINYQCPRGSSDPQACGYRQICPLGSEFGQLCPAGSYVKDNSAAYALNQCQACPVGTYSTLEQAPCLTCEGGYLCYGSTNHRYPTNYTLHHGEACPAGHYCPPGSSSATACPSGTYNPSTLSSSASQCRQCPEATYGALAGQAGCTPCGAYATSVEGQSTCKCKGANRVFSLVDASCRCASGYDYLDSISGQSEGQSSSTEDCIPIVYDRCQDVNQTRDANGQCVDISDCSAACAGGNGTRSLTLGICTCSDALPVDSMCNQNCRANAAQTTPVSADNYTITQGGRSTSISLSTLGSVYGSLNCTAGSSCKVVHTQSSSTGQFSGKYGVSDIIQKTVANTTTKRLLAAERDLAASSVIYSGSIANPVTCLASGDSMLFTLPSSYHYPVYKKDSVINSNAAFDYGAFLTLAQALVQKQANNDNSTSFFAFTFSEAGSYVFTDSQDAEQLMIVVVTEIGQTCADPDRYIQTLTLDSAASFGLSQKSGLILKPNIRLLIGMGAILVLTTALIILGVGYCLRKGWTIRKAAQEGFRQTNHHLDIEHRNSTTYQKLNDFETFKSALVDSDEDDIDNINLHIHEDLLAAGQEYLALFNNEKGKRTSARRAKRAEVLSMMKELEEMICAIGSDAISNQMQLYNEQESADNQLGTGSLALRKQEEREKHMLELEQQRRKDLVEDLPENDKVKLAELKEQLSKGLSSLKKELGKDGSQQLDHTGKHDHEEVAFAIYDNGDVKSRQNQMVKKIELDQDLSELDKENLLRGHEKSLGQIDAVMDAEKRKQEAELEKALKDRADKRRKRLEAQHKKEINVEYKAQESAVREQISKDKDLKLQEIDEEFEAKAEALGGSLVGYQEYLEEKPWLVDLRKERDERRAKIQQQFDQETVTRLQQLKDRIIDKYMAAETDLEAALREQLASQSDDAIERAKAKRQEMKLKLRERQKEEQQAIQQAIEDEKKAFIEEEAEKDPIKEEEAERKKQGLSRGNQNNTEEKIDPQQEFTKVLQELDSQLQQSSLLDQLKEQDSKLADLLKQSEQDQNSKLEARRELLRQRKKLKREQEWEQQRLQAKLKQLEEQDKEKAQIEENYVRDLFGQMEDHEDAKADKSSAQSKQQLLTEHTSDVALARLSNLLMKQFVEKEAALKLLLQKYMDQRLLEKANLKQQFRRDYQKLEAVRSELPDEEFNAVVKELRLKEENMLRELDLQFDMAHKEEETRLRQDLERKHANEQVALRKEDVARQMKLQAELLGKVSAQEEEQERKALKAYEEAKRRDQERKVRALGLQKQEVVQEIEQEMERKYGDYDELLRRQRDEESQLHEQALSIRKKLQERRKKIREAGAVLSKEDQQKLLDQHRQQLEALDSVWEEERRRQVLVMQKRLDQRKAKAAKQEHLKQLVQQQALDSIKDKLESQLAAVYEEETHEVDEKDDQLMRMLKEWKNTRQKQRALDQLVKQAETVVDLDSSTLRKLMLKLDHLERALRELKRIKKTEKQEIAMSEFQSPQLSPPVLEASIIYEDDEEFDPRQSHQVAKAGGVKAFESVAIQSPPFRKVAPAPMSPSTGQTVRSPQMQTKRSLGSQLGQGRSIDYGKLKKFVGPPRGRKL